jgi:hypothetical protein
MTDRPKAAFGPPPFDMAAAFALALRFATAPASPEPEAAMIAPEMPRT